jgi:hypothetical protein
MITDKKTLRQSLSKVRKSGIISTVEEIKYEPYVAD